MFAWELIPTEVNKALTDLVEMRMGRHAWVGGSLDFDWQYSDESAPAMWSQDEVMKLDGAPWPETLQRALLRLALVFRTLGPFVADAQHGRFDPRQTRAALTRLLCELEAQSAQR